METVSDLVMSGTGAIDGWVSARDEAGKVSRSHVTKAPVCPAKDFAFGLKTSRAIERIPAEEREAQSDWHLRIPFSYEQRCRWGWRRETRTRKPSKDESSPIFGGL